MLNNKSEKILNSNINSVKKNIENIINFCFNETTSSISVGAYLILVTPSHPSISECIISTDTL